MDWGDIALHVAIAAASVVLAALIGWHWPAAALVGVAFVAREAVQARHKCGFWLMPWRWSRQKLLEAFGPVVVALVIAGVATIVRGA